MEQIQISPFTTLLTHFRFFLTLRSQEGTYHSLILFRLTPESTTIPESDADNCATDGSENNKVSNPMYKQIYVMESSCPHLGADMSHADIEESDSSLVAVCPWHRYDFDLRTGKSETGLRACTYAVEVKPDPADGVDKVWVETPTRGTGWRLVELRPVSEEFADPPPKPSVPLLPVTAPPSTAPTELEPVVPIDNPPKTLMQWAVLILSTPNPTLKARPRSSTLDVQRTREAVNLFRTGKLSSIGHKATNAPHPPDIPPREETISKNTVDPAKVKNRKSRAVMLHALANIEQWAIDLAWDIIARFGPSHPDIPPAFFSDFTKMALDESKHFTLLTSRLSSISPSTPYGTMPVHASLWDSATVTAHSLRARLAIIHLVHEARGLDVNPGTIARFRKAGDDESVKVMEIIHADEVTHVTSGHRWFSWICEKEGVEPTKAFREEVRKGWRGEVKGPFNVEDREKAGLTREFYEELRGEMGLPVGLGKLDMDMKELKDAVASVAVEYEVEK